MREIGEAAGLLLALSALSALAGHMRLGEGVRLICALLIAGVVAELIAGLMI